MKSSKTLAMLLLATGGGLLAACSSDDGQAQRQAAQPEAIAFAVAGEAATRGGQTGAIATDEALQKACFGVFAYYSDNMLYSAYQHPNFMYNEKVSYDGGWSYKLVKYWPNEYGTNATTGDVDRLSFFAYAPYVDVTPANGQLTEAYDDDAEKPENSTTTGITRLSRATDNGDPQVHYVASFSPKKSVDLVWGVSTGAEFKGIDGSNEAPEAGLPYLNLYKPATEQKVTFAFQHALAALNVQVDATVDGASGTAIDKDTHIYVRSVSFEGFATQGTLVLNNPTAYAPLWLNYMGTATLPTTAVTIYDQRRDGHEATAGDSNELPGGLNGDLVQTAITSGHGVTSDAKNLFDSDKATEAVYVIPNGAPLKVTVVYDVETQDPKLVGDYLSDGKTHGSVIENSVTSVFTGTTLEAGKKYALILHLGMTTVKVDGTVTDWDNTTEEKKLTVSTSKTVEPGNALARRR